MDYEFDFVKVVLETLVSIDNSIDHAYPLNNFDEDRAHVALAAIRGKIKTLRSVASNITLKPEIK
jgi:hypothetical protein